MSKIKFYPVGNGDTCLITTDGGHKLLFDFNAPVNQGVADKRIDLAKELKDELKRSGRTYLDVVSFSHLDKDHFAGSSEFFYLTHAKKYQTPGRIHIREMWVPASVILEKKWEQSPEGRIIQAEARYRLKEGKGIRVISDPNKLDDWLKEQDILPSDVASSIVSAGKLMPGFTMGNAGMDIFIHSPFSYQRDQNTVIDRNAESSVFHVRFRDGQSYVNLMLTADSPYDVMSEIVAITEWAGNKDRLIWDVMKVSHHCSYTSLGPKKGISATTPTTEIKRLYEGYGQRGAILVSPSDIIPSSDTVQPPHRQAAAYYRSVATLKGGKFYVTMEYPTKAAPKPLEIEVKGYGTGATVLTTSSGAAPAVISQRPPRAG